VAIGLGAVGTGIAFILYYVAIDGLGALTASTAAYIPPVVAIIIGTTILNEPVLPSAILAVALILVAAVVTQTPRRSPADRQQSGRPD
jgi:drug/metabolite transporter (DMT)-like permease